MADIFTREDAVELLINKTIFFIGDSNVRALYKDVVQLVTRNDLISSQSLKNKLEGSFMGDRLVAKGPKSNGRNYREERIFEVMENGNVRFAAYYFFITSCYSQYVEEIFGKLQYVCPDIVVYNSCLWDLTRWGPNSIEKHINILPEFVKRLQEVIPPDCYFIWLTALPLSPEIKGGFLLQQLDFLKQGLRFHVLDANQYASRLMSEAGFDVLDLHYYLSWHLDRREEDGVHWQSAAVRYITCLFLTRVSLAWNVTLPNKFESKALQKLIDKNESISGQLNGIPYIHAQEEHVRLISEAQRFQPPLSNNVIHPPFPYEQTIFMPNSGQVQVPDFQWGNNPMINPDMTPNSHFNMGYINSSTNGALTNNNDQLLNFSSNGQNSNLNNPPHFGASHSICNINLGFNFHANYEPMPNYNGFPNGGNDSFDNLARISYFPNLTQPSSGDLNGPNQNNFNPFSQVVRGPNRRYQPHKRGNKNRRRFKNEPS